MAMRRMVRSAAGLFLIITSSAAMAESVTMIGKFPAAYREASFLRRMAIDRFDGNDGQALSFALERALSGGDRHFSILSIVGRSGVEPGAADGIMSGVVTSEVNENRVDQQREDCVAKVEGKCTKKEKVDIVCRRRIIEVVADIRIARARDGSIAYSARKPRHDEVTWCPNQSAPGAVEATIRGMIESIAGETAHEIAPYTEHYAVRFYEKRNGMTRKVGTAFKEAIKQTQRDLPGACQSFAAIEAMMPGHVSVVYNLALCAEARGALETAMALYRRAGDIRRRDTADFAAGIDRTQRLITARNDAREMTRRR